MYRRHCEDPNAKLTHAELAKHLAEHFSKFAVTVSLRKLYAGDLSKPATPQLVGEAEGEGDVVLDMLTLS